MPPVTLAVGARLLGFVVAKVLLGCVVARVLLGCVVARDVVARGGAHGIRMFCEATDARALQDQPFHFNPLKISQ